MQWLRNVSFPMFSVGAAVLLLLVSHLFCAKAQESYSSSYFLHWKPLQTREHESKIEIDHKHRWIAQLDGGWKGWLKVWRLKEDLTIAEEVLSIGGKKGEGFFVKDVEWIGSRLLISIIEGYDTFWEWDKEMEEGTLVSKKVPWQAKWLLFDPERRQLTDLGENEDLIDSKLFSHPSGEMVLIVKRRPKGTPLTRIKVVSLPVAPIIKPEIIKEWDLLYELVPIQWAPDGKHFWGIGGYPLKLFAIGVDNLAIKKLSPDDHELYGSLWREGGMRIEGGMVKDVVTTSGEYVRLMSFLKPRREHICLAYYSCERIEREVVLLDVSRPYPSYLKPLGVCRLIAIAPDGRRLIVQEGWSPRYEDVRGLLVIHWEKKRVWVWDIENKRIMPLGEVGWIEEVYGWIGSEWMIVAIRGEPFEAEVQHDVGGKWRIKATSIEYGLLHIPKD